MVEIAAHRGAITPGPATRQIPTPHKIGQRLRRHIPVLRRGVAGMDQRHQLGRAGQLRHEFGGDQPIGADLGGRWRIGAALDGGLLGDHVNDHRARRRARAGRAIFAPAATPQSIRAGGQRAQRIGAALLTAARVVLTHRGRQRR
jgi:hypothetical protein